MIGLSAARMLMEVESNGLETVEFNISREASMKKYLVSFMKNGELFETIVTANNSFDARECISIKYEIPMNFENWK